MAYDEKCYELAQYFMDDKSKFTEADVQQLAQVIQDAIEDVVNVE